MNIIDAIKSGRKYRQKGDRGYYHPLDKYSRYNFTLEQVLADNWEVEKVGVTITRDSLQEAWKNTVTFNEPYASLILEQLMDELGLALPLF